MPGRVKVKIVAGRNLPIMDRSSFLTDAFVEVRLGNSVYKTDVCRKTLNPSWNSEWYKFELDDEELQEEALQIRVLDHDTYSAHDTIGRVYFDLNPLLEKDGSSSMSGWFPIYDTMHGIRGEIQLAVRVELFSDANRFRQSSLGVKFFYSSCVPHGMVCVQLLGFVEELVVNDDPEYHWIDKIRTSRASNEARQRLFSQLNGQLQRKLGRKVLEVEGNAVLGYMLHFDLEGESGIVVRGIGTAALLRQPQQLSGTPPPISPNREVLRTTTGTESSTPSVTSSAFWRRGSHHRSSSSCSPPPNPGEQSADTTVSTNGVEPPADTEAHIRASSDTADDRGVMRMLSQQNYKSTTKSQIPFEFIDYPFLTLSQYPLGFLQRIGGVVSAKSVKLLDRIRNPDEPETRDAWWSELRGEIRSHMRALACHAVIGYREETSIFEEIIVLSAYGTAAVVDLGFDPAPWLSPSPLGVSLDRASFDREKKNTQSESVGDSVDTRSTELTVDVQLANSKFQEHAPSSGSMYNCSVLHAPYSEITPPFPVTLSRCLCCRRGRVPDLLFTTCDVPLEVMSGSQPALLQARICRFKKDTKGESNAKEISDCLPFLEFELHRQLLDKLKLKGMNALFGLRMRIAIGEESIVAVSTATGVYLPWLPAPQAPRLCNKATESVSSSLLQRVLDHVNKNKESYGIIHNKFIAESSPGPAVDLDNTGEVSDMDISGKDTFVIEVSDEADAEDLIPLLLDEPPAAGITFSTLKSPPFSRGKQKASSRGNDTLGHMFTRIWRGHLIESSTTCNGPPDSNLSSSSSNYPHSGSSFLCSAVPGRHFSGLMQELIKSTGFMFRACTPCHLGAVDFHLSLPDENQLQIMFTGICTPASDDHCSHGTQYPHLPQVSRPADHVFLTPLSTPPASQQVDSYLGNLDFFFVRESSSVREDGGPAGFMQRALAEVQSVVRAHAACLQGNGVLSYHLSEAVLLDNTNRNQAQCLLNVCGDIVKLSCVSE